LHGFGEERRKGKACFTLQRNKGNKLILWEEVGGGKKKKVDAFLPPPLEEMKGKSDDIYPIIGGMGKGKEGVHELEEGSDEHLPYGYREKKEGAYRFDSSDTFYVSGTVLRTSRKGKGIVHSFLYVPGGESVPTQMLPKHQLTKKKGAPKLAGHDIWAILEKLGA